MGAWRGEMRSREGRQQEAGERNQKGPRCFFPNRDSLAREQRGQGRGRGINTVIAAPHNSHWQLVSYRCASCTLHRDPWARVVSGAESCVGSVAQRKGHLSLKSNLQKAPCGLALALIIGHLCLPSGA